MRVLGFTFAATLCVLYAPIVAVIIGGYLLYRTYPRKG